MAWSTPLTATTNAALTAAQWNASVRDNLNETAAAKATTGGTIFAGTGVNSIAERHIDDGYVGTSETTTSTTYAGLATAGPSVIVTTGIQALAWSNTRIANAATNNSYASVAVTGATSSPATDDRAIICDGGTGVQHRWGVCNLLVTTSGSNTFTMQYRVTAGTGTFQFRRLQVMAL